MYLIIDGNGKAAWGGSGRVRMDTAEGTSGKGSRAESVTPGKSRVVFRLVKFKRIPVRPEPTALPTPQVPLALYWPRKEPEKENESPDVGTRFPVLDLRCDHGDLGRSLPRSLSHEGEWTG